MANDAELPEGVFFEEDVAKLTPKQKGAWGDKILGLYADTYDLGLANSDLRVEPDGSMELRESYVKLRALGLVDEQGNRIK